MTDKRQKATKVKCKREQSLTKESKFVDYILPRRGIRVLLELARRWTQHFSKIHQEKRNIERIWMWNPMTTGYIMLTLIYVISMEFLFAESQTFDSSSRNVPFREERGETAVSQHTRAKEFYPLQRAKFTRGIFLLWVLSNHERFYWCAVDQTRSRHRKCSLPRRPLGELGNETRAPLKTPAWEATGNVTRTVLIQIELCARRHTRQGGKWFAPKWRQLMRKI